MSTVLEKAYMLAWKGFSVPSTTYAEIDALIAKNGGFTDNDYAELAAWKTLSLSDEIATTLTEHWRDENANLPDAKVVSRALALQSGHQCLIPISILRGGACKGDPERVHKLLISYYRRRNISIYPRKVILTPDQQQVTKLSDVPGAKAVVNAGPGTGKTCTAIELCKAILRTGKRALLISYTNSALTTLRRRISADPYLGNLYTADAFTSAKSSKLLTPLLLSTVDVMARAILGGARTYGGVVDFEAIINNARVTIQNARLSDPLSVFLENGVTPVFDHIVVDEGQMMSDNRIELIRAVVTGMTRSGINGSRTCNLTIFCDPKQTIVNGAGKWLVTMYENPEASKSEGWLLYSLKRSYRFASPQMLEFVMNISKKRPALHVDLEIDANARNVDHPVAKAVAIDDIEKIAEEMSANYRTSRSVGILAPSYGRTNVVSQQLNAIILQLRKLSTPVCLHGDDNYQANGIVITTFHSCAGMEFSHVYIVGAAGYPSRYPQISYDTGRSLAFVANSRAKVSLTYIIDRAELCVDVDPGTVQMHTNVTEYKVPDKYSPNLPVVTTPEFLFNNGEPLTYLELNAIKLTAYVVASKTLQKSTLYDVMSVSGKPPVLRDPGENLVSQSMLSPSVAHARGLASCGRMILSSGQRVCDVAEKRWSMIPPPNDDPRAAFYWYANQRFEPGTPETSTNAQRLLNAASEMIAKVLEHQDAVTLNLCRQMLCIPRHIHNASFDECYSVHPDFVAKVVTDQKTVEVFVNVGTNPWFALYNGACIWGSKGLKVPVINIDPQSGTVAMYDGFHELLWYHLDNLRRIQLYSVKTLFKDKYLGIERRPPENSYAVDTEFINGTDLYEIGLLCIENPFRSLVSPILSKCLPDIGRITGMGLTQEAFTKIAISSDDMLLRLMETVGQIQRPPKILYYSASMDVNWMCESLSTLDVAAELSTRIIKKGTFASDSKMATLDAVYGSFVGLVETVGRHRAFPDAIMLGEIVRAMFSGVA
jgi:hypothetical protein